MGPAGDPRFRLMVLGVLCVVVGSSLLVPSRSPYRGDEKLARPPAVPASTKATLSVQVVVGAALLLSVGAARSRPHGKPAAARLLALVAGVVGFFSLCWFGVDAFAADSVLPRASSLVTATERADLDFDIRVAECFAAVCGALVCIALSCEAFYRRQAKLGSRAPREESNGSPPTTPAGREQA